MRSIRYAAEKKPGTWARASRKVFWYVWRDEKPCATKAWGSHVKMP